MILADANGSYADDAMLDQKWANYLIACTSEC